MNRLAGKNALVTGGGSGVGEAIALALAEAGAHVTIAGRQRDALEAVAGKATNISPVAADVTDQVSVMALFDAMAKAGASPDIVIANAGAAESMPFAKTDLAAWQAMLDVNLTGVFLTLQAALPVMKDRGWGRIVSVASTAGLKGYPYVASYCAAKHGVVGLTRALALEVALQGITVNAVCPGFTDTPMLERSLQTIIDKTGKSREQAIDALAANNPMGRLIQPDEVADTVLWLCGNGAASVTGQAISISGGEI